MQDLYISKIAGYNCKPMLYNGAPYTYKLYCNTYTVTDMIQGSTEYEKYISLTSKLTYLLTK